MPSFANAQDEQVIPMSNNTQNVKQYRSAKTRVTLPFIEDFSYIGPYPDATLWEDSSAYINNTMSVDQITRGMATLDGLNKFGRPHYPQSFNSGLADSLTSKSINLASYTANDSIYFSFFYQPQGLGFAPENKDSLFLYFKNNSNQWKRVWQIRGTPYQGFKFVIFPVFDAQFLHSDFQFRFINVASIGSNDDVWNLDYIKMDQHRNIDDSLMKDVAFTNEPSSILLNYTSMPYRHFIANQANEKALSHQVNLRNSYNTPHNISTTFNADEILSGSFVNTQGFPSVVIGGQSYIQQSFSPYNISFVPPTAKSKVVIQNKYFYTPVNATDRRLNDTITRDIIFDNYFAYDDGSAEKSYFLLPALNFPSKTALSFTLNEPDTVRGVMVHFGSQAPSAAGKFFSIVLYKSIGAGVVNDSIILQEDLYKVTYEPTYNGFSTYAFTTPPRLDTGTYYIGLTQPANFGSDSIYYGLDVNTNAASQHLSYNVDGTWYNSTINGSIMMRPIVGQEFIPTAVKNISKNEMAVSHIYPNPAINKLTITSDINYTNCNIYSLDGRLIYQLTVSENKLDISRIAQGTYIFVFNDAKGNRISKKIIKL